VSVALSENATKLLRQVVALRRKYSDGYIPDHILWEAANLDPDPYYDAAEQLLGNQLVKRQGKDFATLKATPKGMQLAEAV
jgi:RIO-like serine/threonine protein kinase